MTDAIKLSDLGFSDLPGKASRRGETPRGTFRESGGPRQTHTACEPASVSLSHETGSPRVATTRSGVEMHRAQPCELDRLYRSLADVTPRNHPRTARLLASSTRKTAQKVIEEAGEVAIEAVKHRPQGIVRESADLLYHVVALWHRAGIDPKDVWTEMRVRADTLGIAEKLPKARGGNDRCRPIRTIKRPPGSNRP
jgi:phosphoribosyl-ATP pyrophosphohydrolase